MPDPAVKALKIALPRISPLVRIARHHNRFGHDMQNGIPLLNICVQTDPKRRTGSLKHFNLIVAANRVRR
jgi:hypothetical protein